MRARLIVAFLLPMSYIRKLVAGSSGPGSGGPTPAHARPRNRPLRFYLLAVTLTLVPLAAFILGAHKLVNYQGAQRIVSDSARTGKLLARFVEDPMDRSVRFLEAFAARPDVLSQWQQQQHAELSTTLARMRKLNPDFAALAMYGPQGDLRAMTPADATLAGQGHSVAELYSQLQTRESYVSPFYQPAGSTGFTAVIAVPLRDQNGALLGMVVGQQTLDTVMHSVYAYSTPENSSLFFLVDQNGQIFGKQDGKVTLVPANRGIVEQLAKASPTDSGTRMSIGKQEVIAAYSPIPSLGWGVLVSVPITVIEDSLWKVERILGIFGAVILVLAAGVGGVLAMRFHRFRVREQEYQQKIELQNRELSHEIDSRRQSEEERDRFFSMALDLLCIAGFDGYFKRVNPAFADTLGYTAEEFLALPFMEFVHPDDKAPTLQAMETLQAGGVVVGFENRYRRKDGAYRWLAWKAVAHPDGLIYATGRDVSERRHYETELRESEERYRALFKSSPFPMWTFDLNSLRFLEVNDAAVRHYGYSKAEFLAMTVADIRPEADVPRLMKALTIQTQEKDRFGLWRHRKKDGQLIDAEISSHRLSVGEHVVDLVVAVDVTERLRSQAQIEAQNQALELSRKEAERANQLKSQFLASMSHELRTPLNAILGFSELLEDQTPGPLNEKQSRFVEHIRTGARHLLQLINDILDLSRIEAGQLELQLEDFKLYSAVPEVISLIRPLAMTKRVTLEVPEPRQEVTVCADRLRVKQILYNLLSNAVKFTPQGGRVTLQVSSQDGLPAIIVTDTGIGIRLEDQAVIFEEFRQVGEESEKQQGTGLGLAITRRLVQSQGGSIRVESAPGKGSRFIVLLTPGTKALEAAIPAAPVVMEPRPVDRRSPLVLVIDDDPLTRQLVASFLTPEGFDVRGCDGGETALSLARELQPDAITLDVLMPVSGWSILGDLKKDSRTADIPVILVTIVDQRNAGFALGAADYLVKPVSRDTLLRTLRRHLAPTSKPQRILILDDNAADRNVATAVLESAGFVALQASGGKQGLQMMRTTRPTALLLDLVMPGMDGFEVLRQMKQDDSLRSIPVFVLTGKDLTGDEAMFLSREAQALLTKAGPWKEDLLVKLRGVLRRPNAEGMRA